MEQAIEVFAAIQLMIVGLSHIIQAGAWVDFFIWLRERGNTGVFLHGLMSLWFGSLILAFHHSWFGLTSVLTAVGYLYLLKASLCFLLPSSQIRSLRRVSHERAWEIKLAGVVFVAVAGILCYAIWIGSS